MTIQEFKNTELYKNTKSINYYGINGKNISNKPYFILKLLAIIGTSLNSDGSISVDVNYIE